MTAKKPTVKELEEQIAELTDALQRERADVINVRRRHEEQIASLRTSLKAHVVKDLLPIIDNFERALKHSPVILEAQPKDLTNNTDSSGKPQNDETLKPYLEFVKGVQGVVKQFEKTLADMGVEKIKTVGEHFDPHLHEAVSMEEGDGKHEIVSEEIQSGYKLGDDVIRHAMVRVKG